MIEIKKFDGDLCSWACFTRLLFLIVKFICFVLTCFLLFFCNVVHDLIDVSWVISGSVYFRPATLLKKRLWHKCFPVDFVKFLRIPFLQNTSGRLRLSVIMVWIRALTKLSSQSGSNKLVAVSVKQRDIDKIMPESANNLSSEG